MSFIGGQIVGALFVAWCAGLGVGLVWRTLGEIHKAIFKSGEGPERE